MINNDSLAKKDVIESIFFESIYFDSFTYQIIFMHHSSNMIYPIIMLFQKKKMKAIEMESVSEDEISPTSDDTRRTKKQVCFSVLK